MKIGFVTLIRLSDGRVILLRKGYKEEIYKNEATMWYKNPQILMDRVEQ